jgi:glyoxylase I family protein
MRHPNPINIRAIDHVVIRVTDLDGMIAFYTEVLGCRLERGPGELGLAQLRAGASLIDLVDVGSALGREGGAAPDHGAPNLDHVCLQVQPWDLDAIGTHLRRHGVDVGEVAMRYGATGMGPSLYLRDPEGNTVELKGERND